ncbi:sodium:proton exchanger [Actinomycetospora endophytica]|uniref:Sodium:proton exchanger n=1 Tax=Actinomycetospora endophytica TaxID=2291215 RepID=A0ABS8PA43_9PSEU|nr:sodium:proton exchanger [Actinomycetospora endophytica]MCD2194797.1 sodium:proton exchanger [Actinomycetospora endophytica]
MIPIIEFVLGIAVLVYSAEKLIAHLVGVASRWAISLFLVAVVFTGIEFDDLAYGIVLNIDDLKSAALGTVIGTTVAMTGIVLALAALIAPCEFEVPKSYLVLFVASPIVMYAFAATGALTLVTGVILCLLFVAFVGWIAYCEKAGRRPIWRNEEFYEQLETVGAGVGGGAGTATLVAGGDDAAPGGGNGGGAGPGVGGGPGGGGPGGSGPGGSGSGGFDLPPDLRVDQAFLRARQHSPWAALGWAVVALIGLVIGAIVAGQGTDGILNTFDIDGTVFGVTIATLALSLEDIFLTVEPQRRGAPEIGIANVLGSVVFSVTGKLGIVLLIGGAITVDADVLRWHLPVLIVMTALSAIFLATGRLRRWHGAVLLGLYVIYFVVSLVAFSGVPVDTS